MPGEKRKVIVLTLGKGKLPKKWKGTEESAENAELPGEEAKKPSRKMEQSGDTIKQPFPKANLPVETVKMKVPEPIENSLNEGQLLPVSQPLPVPTNVLERKRFSPKLGKVGHFLCNFLARTCIGAHGTRIVLGLGRHEVDNDWYTIKLLQMNDEVKDDTNAEIEAKVQLHNEMTILNTLRGVPGIIQHHGMFENVVHERVNVNGKMTLTGRKVRRLCLVLDCFSRHNFTVEHSHFSSLFDYILELQRLDEVVALHILRELTCIVKHMHGREIVHRDLNTKNIYLNTLTSEVWLGNFAIAKSLETERTDRYDQQPSRLLPNFMLGGDYGKKSDIWNLGLVFQSMLYGQDTTNNNSLGKRFLMSYFHNLVGVSPRIAVTCSSALIMKSLLSRSEDARPTADQLLTTLDNLINSRLGTETVSAGDRLEVQVVPGTVVAQAKYMELVAIARDFEVSDPDGFIAHYWNEWYEEEKKKESEAEALEFTALQV